MGLLPTLRWLDPLSWPGEVVKKWKRRAQRGVCASRDFFLPCTASDVACCLFRGPEAEGRMVF